MFSPSVGVVLLQQRVEARVVAQWDEGSGRLTMFLARIFTLAQHEFCYIRTHELRHDIVAGGYPIRTATSRLRSDSRNVKGNKT